MTPTVWSREQAEQEKREDLAQLRVDERWHDMTMCLRLWVGQNLPRMRREISKGPDWWVPIHFELGMIVRNHLRENGYDELEIGIKNLDNVYVELLEDAART